MCCRHGSMVAGEKGILEIGLHMSSRRHNPLPRLPTPINRPRLTDPMPTCPAVPGFLLRSTTPALCAGMRWRRRAVQQAGWQPGQVQGQPAPTPSIRASPSVGAMTGEEEVQAQEGGGTAVAGTPWKACRDWSRTMRWWV